MGGPTAEQLAQRAYDLGILTDRQREKAWGTLGTQDVSTADFLQLMVRGEYMTNYQVERLLKGDRTGFFYGDYKVLYMVGSGSFARVFRAVHRETGKVVAVKVLRNRFSEDSANYGPFVQEGEVGETLLHPNIVSIYEVHSQGNVHFFVMEFVEGQNLREFVKIRKKLTPEESTRLAIDICNGLTYSYKRGLHHRDLKMSNILVSSLGQAKLVDFGLVGTSDKHGGTEGVDLEMANARTIDYAALERATGVRRDDSRSDIYFLGCIYYNMLTGKPPLVETRDRTQRLSKTRFENIKPIQELDPSIPHVVSRVVNKAMEFDPDRRYQSPDEMVTDLMVADNRLADGDTGPDSATDSPLVPATPVVQQSIMVVESNVQMQDVFRSGFKKAGYRVLLTSDPDRAFDRFFHDPDVAECILLNAQVIGRSAVEVFNRFGEDEEMAKIPILLLLDEDQREWSKELKARESCRVLGMPITMKKLRTELSTLLGTPETLGEVS